MTTTKIAVIALLIPFVLASCFFSRAAKTVRKSKKIVAHVKVAVKEGGTKNYKKAGLHVAMATALATTDVEDVGPFVKAFEQFVAGDEEAAGTTFCRGMVKNDIKNPAIILGAMAAITLVGQRNSLHWKRFLKSMWKQTKTCAGV